MESDSFVSLACREFPEIVLVFPVVHRPDRPGYEPAPAVWTNVNEEIVDTGCATYAFERADACLKRMGRQRLIAVLAIRSEFKHGVLDLGLSITANQWFLKLFRFPTFC
jgi:hypothetical protein